MLKDHCISLSGKSPSKFILSVGYVLRKSRDCSPPSRFAEEKTGANAVSCLNLSPLFNSPEVFICTPMLLSTSLPCAGDYLHAYLLVRYVTIPSRLHSGATLFWWDGQMSFLSDYQIRQGTSIGRTVFKCLTHKAVSGT